MRSFVIYIVALAVGLNLLLCALQLMWLRRRRPWPKFIALGLVAWTLAMLGLFFIQAFAPARFTPFLRHWFYFPLSVEMVWNVLLLQPLVLIALVTTLALRFFRPVRKADPPATPKDISRRKFIYMAACGAAPALALSMGVHGTLSCYDLRVRRFDIPIANLPPDLEGFTIAHVSDLHSGMFCGPERLKSISSATNDLKADLIAITGDIINRDMREFPAALDAIQQMHAPHGMLVCEGNHDLIPGPMAVRRACAENNLTLLLNRTTNLAVGGSRLLIAGVPWLGGNFVDDPDRVSRLYPERREGDVRILLAHHPHYFDIAQSADLVLTGHTHGGQIMAGPVGLGPLFFKYWSGLYRHGTSTLIVSNGCGDWFPCRIGAPAEIGLLRLTKATA